MTDSHSILITGGAGYLGSTMVSALLAAGHSVTVLDNFMFKQNALSHVCADPRFDVVRGDAREEQTLRPLSLYGRSKVEAETAVLARVFLHGIDNFEAMRDRPYNVGLSDANLSKWELCERIRAHIPGFVFMEAPIGEDLDKRDYIVSNARIGGMGYKPAHSLDDGIAELIKGYRMLRNSLYSNV